MFRRARHRTRERGFPPWWEMCGRIPLLFQLGLAGLALVVVQASGLLREGRPLHLALPGLALALVQMFAGLAAFSGRVFLAGAYMAALLFASLLSTAPPTAGGVRLAGALLYGAGTAWVLLRRLNRHRPSSRLLRTASLAFAGLFLTFLPATGRDLGRVLGTAIGDGAAASPPAAGDLMPDVRFRGLDGRWVGTDEPGALYVLSFWATWCPPCLRELPGLAAMAASHAGDRSVRFLAINTEEADPRALKAFLEGIGVRGLPLAEDPEHGRETLGVRSLPTTLLVRDRRILARYEGYRPDLCDLLRSDLSAARDDGG